jgi:hypothetical protein
MADDYSRASERADKPSVPNGWNEETSRERKVDDDAFDAMRLQLQTSDEKPNGKK